MNPHERILHPICRQTVFGVLSTAVLTAVVINAAMRSPYLTTPHDDWYCWAGVISGFLITLCSGLVFASMVPHRRSP